MARFRLRYGLNDVDLPAQGELIVGRGNGCDILLDDPLASRRHAKFESRDGQLWIEDLGSRNGVTVNDKRVQGRTALSPNDVVVVAAQSFLVTMSDGPSVKLSRPMAVTLQRPTNDQPTALGMRSALIEKAFAVGRVEDVEAILESFLNSALGDLQRQPNDSELLSEITRYALRLANETSKTRWMDWVFIVHRAAGRVPPATVIDELHTIARKVKQPATGAMKDYLMWAQGRTEQWTATERFVVQRIEGLLRSMSA